MPENIDNPSSELPFSKGDLVHPKGQSGKAGAFISSTQMAGDTYCRVKHLDGRVRSWPARQLVKTDLDVDDGTTYDGYSGPKDLLLNITYHKLRGNLADVIYSMEASQIDFYAHQYKPVLKLLESPCEGILLADEVGLGKTIEAGLIWTELRARFQAKRLLIICPAILKDKWRDELKNKFGVSATLEDASGVLYNIETALQDPSHAFAMIASYDGLRPPKGWDDDDEQGPMPKRRELARLLDSRNDAEEPIIDLLVADEAHKARNPSSQTNKLLNLINPSAGHRALLSATPIQLKSDNLYQLLNFLDPEAFDNKDVFQTFLDANRPLVAAVDKLGRQGVERSEVMALLEEASNNRLLQHNQTLKDAISMCNEDSEFDEKARVLLKDKISHANLLNHVISRSTKSEVFENRVRRDVTAFPVTLTECERDFYDQVTDSIRSYADDRNIPGGFLYVTPQMQISSSMIAALNHWQEADAKVNEAEDSGYDLDEDEEEADERPMLNHIRESLSGYTREHELREVDSKFELMSQTLDRYLEEKPNAKVVIFAYFKSTLRYLKERLERKRIKAELLMGGIAEPKETVIGRFRDPRGAQVLLSSEVGSEGIDLQFAEVLINYDLPWNPMRVEQRIGRLDRIGQDADKIQIWNFFAEDTIDARIYKMLYDRLDLIQETLGGMEEILGEKISGLTRVLLSSKLTPEEQAERINQTALAIEKVKEETVKLEGEAADLVAHGDYITQRIHKAKDLSLWLKARDIEDFLVQFFCRCYPNTIIVPVKGEVFRIELCPETEADYQNFCRAKKHPSGRLNNCVFGTKVVDEAAGRSEIINQFHSLTRFAADRTANHEGLRLDRFKLRIKCSESDLPPGQYAFFISKWAVAGIRDYEKFDYRMKRIGSDQIESGQEIEKKIGDALSAGRDWINPDDDDLDAETADREITLCYEDGKDDLKQWFDSIRHRNHDRIDLQKASLKAKMSRKITSLNESLDRARAKSNQTSIKTFETRIQNTERDFQRKLEVLDERQRRATEDPEEDISEVCWGILKVGDE